MKRQYAKDLKWLYPEYSIETIEDCNKAITLDNFDLIVDTIFDAHEKELQELNQTTCDLYSLVSIDTKINLCDTCSLEFATCKSKMVFGNGYGNDNVIKCDGYKNNA